MKVVILLLAAGESKRLGRPKQLLPFKGRPLLKYLCEVAAGAEGVARVVVVLGAGAERIEGLIDDWPKGVKVVVNAEWKLGMGGSIRRGMRACGECDAVIIMLCDQPFVTRALLGRLMAVFRKRKEGLVACRYGGAFGPPVLFGREFFGALRTLPHKSGARAVIKENWGAARWVTFAKGAMDIDTEKDWDTALM